MPNTDPVVYSVDEFIDSFSGTKAVQGQTVAAVVGRPVAHSKSPVLHTAAATAAGLNNFSYVRVEAGELDELHTLLQRCTSTVAGFSVTMPGKTAALELADTTEARADAIGSANTLVHRGDGSWAADNTDVVGVQRCLEYLATHGVELKNQRAVVVGNGGTARPAVAALAAQGFTSVTVVARSDRALNLKPLADHLGLDFEWHTFDSVQAVKHCQRAAVLINTVPADIAAAYVDMFTAADSVLDVIYDPYPTPLMKAAAAAQKPVADGLRMLVGQAEQQFQYFTGTPAPAGVMAKEVGLD